MSLGSNICVNYSSCTSRKKNKTKQNHTPTPLSQDLDGQAFHLQANSFFFTSTKHSLSFSLAPSCCSPPGTRASTYQQPGRNAATHHPPHRGWWSRLGYEQVAKARTEERMQARGDSKQRNNIGRAFLEK